MPDRKYTVYPCDCGSREFEISAGEPVRCEECGSIPPGLSHVPVNDPAATLIEVRDFP